ncbi:EAL domain-containing protein [Bradyrhizobium sp. LHD-71]|uniref:EAL domain-containing protein n=1 Tax=Bradyrhizobium sp. LHD-71 TaxID=3072141 RepID=UPI00280E8542|nr:EAL domain-containing protein [Bradyrhizobium sp. LHD-71]MDQ8729863.1 EAL domain-containing protein [Bradyrhizobium sp. LHD-71]
MQSALPGSSRRLLKLVAPFLAIVIVQAMLAGASMAILTSVRAYIAGESLWSKGEKEAVSSLLLYLQTRDADRFARYEAALAIPLGDLEARRALEQDPVDLEQATKGFIQGGNHPDDIPGLIRLFRYFRWFSYFSAAVDSWRATDAGIEELVRVGGAIKAAFADNSMTPTDLTNFRRQIELVDARIAPEALRFSESLGQGSRLVAAILTSINVVGALGLAMLVLWHLRNLLMQGARSERALKAEKERAQITLASIGDAVVATDALGRIDYLNPAAERLIGTTCLEAQGQTTDTLFRIIESGDEGAIVSIASSTPGSSSIATMQLVRPDGSRVAVSRTSSALDPKSETSLGAVLVLHDRTVEQEFIQRLSHQAAHDALTGLANRPEFERCLTVALNDQYAALHALMVLDVDQFKNVNDTCGHAAGDQLLRQIADILQQQLASDDLVARLGGDEFAVLLRHRGERPALGVAERIRNSVEQFAFSYRSRPFAVTVSAGLVSLGQCARSLEEVLRAADTACYLAKQSGRNRVEVYRSSETELTQRMSEMAWLQRLNLALENDGFCLYEQTIVSLQAPETDEGAHVEVLLRLKDLNGALVAPGSFMPAAERYGLTELLDRWVIRNALPVLAARLKQEQATIETCAINLSEATLTGGGFVDFVHEQFVLHDVPPSLICFEIAETTAVSNLSAAGDLIRSLRRLGCRFALDDFGSGMSSFAYLKTLPIDYLKIDGGMVRHLVSDRVDRAMVEMIAQAARVLRVATIAEWAETPDIVELLRQLGIDYAQGYAVGRPQPFCASAKSADEKAREVA